MQVAVCLWRRADGAYSPAEALFSEGCRCIFCSCAADGAAPGKHSYGCGVGGVGMLSGGHKRLSQQSDESQFSGAGRSLRLSESVNAPRFGAGR